MIASITRYASTRDLLSAAHVHALTRAGRHRPHAIAAWRPGVDLPAPGSADMDRLVDELNEPLIQFAADTGSRPGRSRQVWQCALRTHPDSAPLSDQAWANAARRVLAAAGIAPPGDEAACRWIALRIDDHEARIVAPLMRQDGRTPRTHQDISRVTAVCQLIELETTGSRRHTAALTRNIPTVISAQGPATAPADHFAPGRLAAPSR
ncbi:hypothetical protein ABZW30_08225 [Kitasatospora sp. NPDC004669]|uniref:hypothetical protein n=1 Tax=Kitasatospora sp. NPDC004669 TaxID=3154555 RepID=UPI0033A39D75